MGEYDDVVRSSDNNSKLAVVAVGARGLTLLLLSISAIILHTNDAYGASINVIYKMFHSYKYLFYLSVFGIVYGAMLLPFAIYYMKKRKHLINSYNFLKFNFYADKIVTLVVGTGAGAAFGVTMDFNSVLNNNPNYDDSQMQEFFSKAYIAATCALLASIAFGVSSVHSSLLLTTHPAA